MLNLRAQGHVSARCPRRLRLVGKEQKEVADAVGEVDEDAFETTAELQQVENHSQARADEVTLEHVIR